MGTVGAHVPGMEQHFAAITRHLQLPRFLYLFKGEAMGDLLVEQISVVTDNLKYPVNVSKIPVPSATD